MIKKIKTIKKEKRGLENKTIKKEKKEVFEIRYVINYY